MDGPPDIYYRRETDGAGLPNNLLAGMLRCRHDGNPDFAHLYPQVQFWFLEVDRGRVLREVGFSELIGAEGNAIPIVLAPYGRNPGLWTTLGVVCSRRYGTEIEAAVFEAAWRKLLAQLPSAGTA